MPKDRVITHETPEMEKKFARIREKFQAGIRDGSIRVEYEPGYIPRTRPIQELVRTRIERERMERLLNATPNSPLIQ